MKTQNERKKKKSAFKKFTKIWALIYLVALLIFECALMALDVLPEKTLLILFVVMIAVSILLFIQLFFNNVKKGRKIVALIISTLLIVVYGVGTAYAMGTLSFLGNVTAKKKAEKAVAVTEKPFNVYISGMDTTGDINKEKARSDVNMIATVNPKTHHVLLTSIPRDYRVTLQNGATDKLTHTGMMGIKETIADVEALTGLEINYYVKVNYSTLKDLVNSIGGIDVVSEHEFTSYIGRFHFVQGKNHMDGAQALAFARERQAFRDGDVQRVKNQQLVMDAIVRKMTHSRTLMTKYNKILNYIAPTMEMNFTDDEVKGLVKFQLKENPNWTFESSTITGFDSSERVFSGGSTPVYVMAPDKESVKAAAERVKAVMKEKPEKEKGKDKKKKSK